MGIGQITNHENKDDDEIENNTNNNALRQMKKPIFIEKTCGN